MIQIKSISIHWLPRYYKRRPLKFATAYKYFTCLKLSDMLCGCYKPYQNQYYYYEFSWSSDVIAKNVPGQSMPLTALSWFVAMTLSSRLMWSQKTYLSNLLNDLQSGRNHEQINTKRHVLKTELQIWVEQDVEGRKKKVQRKKRSVGLLLHLVHKTT